MAPDAASAINTEPAARAMRGRVKDERLFLGMEDGRVVVYVAMYFTNRGIFIEARRSSFDMPDSSRMRRISCGKRRLHVTGCKYFAGVLTCRTGRHRITINLPVQPAGKSLPARGPR